MESRHKMSKVRNPIQCYWQRIFCPHCGFNSVEKVLDESLDTISKMLNSVSEMKLMFSDMYGKDKVETMSRSMIEGAIGDVVFAFQKFV